MMEIPVYLVVGFLDAGKTKFINNILGSNFAKEDKTLLICCEEGELEYDPINLDNVTIAVIDDEEDLTSSKLKEWQMQYQPQQVLIEYNGMWQMKHLYQDALPSGWVLAQIITVVKADTFEMYAKNMGQLMMEKIIKTNLVIFNRCTVMLCNTLRRHNLRMVNRQAGIYFENEDGSSENYLTDSSCPFDLKQERIDIPDEKFGIWYVDVMDNPERYVKKLVHMKLMIHYPDQYPNTCCPGRLAMVCCENDIQFLGIFAKGNTLKEYTERDWVEVIARIELEHIPPYKSNGPALNVISIARCKKPDRDFVTF